MSKQKRPKRYECLNCGFISDRIKKIKFPGITFAVCFKCRGKLKERDEWVKWHREETKEWIESLYHSRQQRKDVGEVEG